MKLEIEQFMTDSRRPDWLIRLLYEVRTYCPESGAIAWIRSAINDATLVRRSKVYPLTDCVRIEESEDSLTIYTLYKDTPMVQFRIKQ
jgi:hypothetical protein